MATTRLTLPDLYEDGFRVVFHDGFARQTGEVESIFNMMTSVKKDETDTRVGTLGLVPVRTEGDSIVYDDPPPGFDVTYTHLEYAMGFQVTQIAREDDQYSTQVKLPSQLGASMRLTLEQDAQNDLNNSYSGSFTGGDGVALVSSAHPLPGGGTESNVLAVAAEVDQVSYEQALIDVASWVDDRGKLINMQPEKLFHHRNNNFNMDKLFGSNKDPDSANNAINPASSGRRGITPVQLNYLTDPEKAWIQCTQHFMTFFWRVSPEFGRDNDFETDNLRFKGRARWSHGWSDWYGMFGFGDV